MRQSPIKGLREPADSYKDTGSTSVYRQYLRRIKTMPFKVVFLAHASDAEPDRDRSLIETSTYKLFSVVVKDQVQAVDECRRLVKDEGIHSVLLCPGFSDKNVAEITEAVGENVGVAVARGGPPGRRVPAKVRIEAYTSTE